MTHSEGLKLQLFERLIELKYPDVVEAREQIETLSRVEYDSRVKKLIENDRREKQRQEVRQQVRRDKRADLRAQAKSHALMRAMGPVLKLIKSDVDDLQEQKKQAQAELDDIESKIARLKEEEKQAKANRDGDSLSEVSSPEDS